ncbi:hypothetical protein GMLC_01540 [Geomonas limicola]|uniref:Uncharacterized protein n=1 Tax=Geomonas limicola TaxID=2740186 RepID=A0A6V8N250_9BACT|nr:hypothetical protein GMLC_01540 [Geomonas limicola]
MSKPVDPLVHSPLGPAGAPCVPSRREDALSEPVGTGPAPAANTDTPAQVGVSALHSRAGRCACREIPLDLFREGANISELSLRQSRCLTPLTLSSRAAQDLLRQF